MAPKTETLTITGTMKTLEGIPHPQSILTGQSERGKGVLTSEAEVLSYPDISDTTHEFGALLQFGTTFELMELLATHQIKVSQWLHIRSRCPNAWQKSTPNTK